MSQLTRRTAIAAVVAVALASLTAIGGAPSASGQDGSGIVGLPTPAVGGPSHTMADPGTGPEAGNATTSPISDAVPAEAVSSTRSVLPESVIGADGRTLVPQSATSTFPLRAIGQIELLQADGPNPGNYICTGWLIDDNSILTSGHCSYDGGINNIIESATFFPGRNNTTGTVVNPFGSCAVNGVWAPDAWKFNASASSDFSVQQLNCNIGATIGHFGMFSLPGTNAFAGRRMRVEGYPGDLGQGSAYGSRWMMAGNVHHSSANNLFYPMDTAGGQSGSPVFKFNRPSCGGPCGGAVHSYGAGGNPLNNSGPRLSPSRISTIAGVAAENGG